MNENINLCEILKGHEGETFYIYSQGDCTLMSVNDIEIEGYPIKVKAKFFNEYSYDISEYSLKADGTVGDTDDLILFPSKNQRDWDKWIKEQKHKIPKTWSELEEVRKCKVAGVIIAKTSEHEWFTGTYCESPTEKSALAFLKISQLIEVGYGGNVTNEEWKLNTIKYIIDCNKNNFYITLCNNVIHHIAFHTKEQAKEFLQYSENVQLLKDYFMNRKD